MLFIVRLDRNTAFARAYCVNHHKIIWFDIIYFHVVQFSKANLIAVKCNALNSIVSCDRFSSSFQRREKKMREKKATNRVPRINLIIVIMVLRCEFMQAEMHFIRLAIGYCQSWTHLAVTHFTKCVYILFVVTSVYWWVDRSLVTFNSYQFNDEDVKWLRRLRTNQIRESWQSINWIRSCDSVPLVVIIIAVLFFFNVFFSFT